jgi:hypothetical protein
MDALFFECKPRDPPGSLYTDDYVEVLCVENGYQVKVKQKAQVLESSRWVLVTFPGEPRMTVLTGKFVCRTKGVAIKRYGVERQYLVAFR